MITEHYRNIFKKSSSGYLMFLFIEKYLKEADASGLPFQTLLKLTNEAFDETNPPLPKRFGERLREKIKEASV